MKLFAMTDSGGSNVFHTAAFLNRAWVFEFLRPETEYLAQEWDKNGDLPIHIASKMGHVHLIEKLKPVSTRLNKQGQTILHVAAKYGRASVVRYILRDPKLGRELNTPDDAGNTALHLTAVHSQPAALIHLVWSEEIELRVCNNECLTAFDIARRNMAMEHTKRQQLVLLALACSVAGKVPPVSTELLILRPEARDKEFPSLVRSRKNKPDRDIVKDYIGARLVVATLVATVTFAAGFAVPGGFDSSDKTPENDLGMATMLDKRMFQAFVICNTIAMFCSMTVVVNLIWARLVDVEIAVTAFQHTTLPLKIALLAISTAFLTGVTLTVGKLSWLANTIFYLGLPFLLIISGAILLEHPPVFITIQNCPIRRLTLWLILAYIKLWRVETYIYDDTEDDRRVNETFPSRPADGAGELKTDDSATAKCEDAPSNH
ncbi:hypothetical protein EUGRSUZ_L02762 [Eucalyptus grandis]|uniref:PGG domain-containing protein n=1 Tax=Eucalyptus grandis TaxID=71139 RepID=A0AAD9WIS1_EUCGR|nr:hypothetical protein EUGRSUZ_L02762 [Eucalyptus grandis]